MAPSFQEKLDSARLDISNMTDAPQMKNLNNTLGIDKSPFASEFKAVISPGLAQKFERVNELVGTITNNKPEKLNPSKKYGSSLHIINVDVLDNPSGSS